MCSKEHKFRVSGCVVRDTSYVPRFVHRATRNMKHETRTEHHVENLKFNSDHKYFNAMRFALCKIRNGVEDGDEHENEGKETQIAVGCLFLVQS